MNIFKRVTLEWWHVAALKISVFALGIAVGASWPELFARYVPWLVSLAFVFGAYVGIVWLKSK